MAVVQVITVTFWGFVVVGLLVRVLTRSTPGGRRARSGAGDPVMQAGAVESELYGFPTRVLPAPEPMPVSYSLIDDTPRDPVWDLTTRKK